MMNLNQISAGIEFVGSNVQTLNIRNSIVDIEKEGKRRIGLNINEPIIESDGDTLFGHLSVDFEIEVEQSEDTSCNIEFTIEGAFVSKEKMDEQHFFQLVAINGAAALIGIARGKIEAITANIFNNGKIVIPFINVVEYYKNSDD